MDLAAFALTQADSYVWKEKGGMERYGLYESLYAGTQASFKTNVPAPVNAGWCSYLTTSTDAQG